MHYLGKIATFQVFYPSVKISGFATLSSERGGKRRRRSFREFHKKRGGNTRCSPRFRSTKFAPRLSSADGEQRRAGLLTFASPTRALPSRSPNGGLSSSAHGLRNHSGGTVRVLHPLHYSPQRPERTRRHSAQLFHFHRYSIPIAPRDVNRARGQTNDFSVKTYGMVLTSRTAPVIIKMKTEYCICSQRPRGCNGGAIRQARR